MITLRCRNIGTTEAHLRLIFIVSMGRQNRTCLSVPRDGIREDMRTPLGFCVGNELQGRVALRCNSHINLRENGEKITEFSIKRVQGVGI